MHIFLSAAALSLAAAAAAPALAQDAASPFQGLRIEGIGGWDRVQANDNHKDGVLYGGGAGYDLQRGHVVLGVEGEISDSGAKSCAGAETVANPRTCLKAARDLYVGGRVGTLLTPRTLLYGKVGYTNARAKLTSDTGTSEVSLGHENLDGIRAGAGLEYAISPRAFIKTEYRYSNYEAGVTRHQVLGGVGLRF